MFWVGRDRQSSGCSWNVAAPGSSGAEIPSILQIQSVVPAPRSEPRGELSKLRREFVPLQPNYSAQNHFPRCNYLGALCSERDAGGGGIKTLISLIAMRESLAIPEQRAELFKTRVISKQNSIYIQIRNQAVALKEMGQICSEQPSSNEFSTSINISQGSGTSRNEFYCGQDTDSKWALHLITHLNSAIKTKAFPPCTTQNEKKSHFIHHLLRILPNRTSTYGKNQEKLVVAKSKNNFLFNFKPCTWWGLRDQPPPDLSKARSRTLTPLRFDAREKRASCKQTTGIFLPLSQRLWFSNRLTITSKV